MNVPMRPWGQDAQAPTQRVLPPASVLVVDDDAGKRLALKSVLAPLGFPIVEADSGQSALRRVITQNFAVILLDVRMPIMGGFETAALIRLRLQSQLTPIIFITAYAADEIEADRYNQGAVDFLFSPIRPDELRAKVSFYANVFIQAEEAAGQARELQAYADQLRLLTEAAPIGIFQTDADNNYRYTNPQWSQITGIPAEAAVGQAWDFIIDPEQRVALGTGGTELGERSGQPTQVCHRLRIPCGDSAPRIALVNSRPISDEAGGISGWVGILSDVTVEAEAEALMFGAQVALEELNVELAASARRDPLTGLGNRLALEEDMELMQARVTRYGHRYCMAILDIDHFKAFNDTYGHQVGDEGIRAVAAQLSQQARTGDMLYRYGGDEFLCVFPEQGLAAGTIAIQRMRFGVERLGIPHSGNPGDVLTISAGLATLDPSSARAAHNVLKEADEALYQAKRLGRNRVEHVESANYVAHVAKAMADARAAEDDDPAAPRHPLLAACPDLVDDDVAMEP